MAQHRIPPGCSRLIACSVNIPDRIASVVSAVTAHSGALGVSAAPLVIANAARQLLGKQLHAVMMKTVCAHIWCSE